MTGLQERLKNDFDLEMPIAEWLDKEPELSLKKPCANVLWSRRESSISVKKKLLALK